MGFRFRKSKSFGPFRVNLSKSGVGWSFGNKWFRYTKKAGGGTRTTSSIPGTGISYVKDYGAGRGKRKGAAPSHPVQPSGNGPTGTNSGCLMWGVSICLILCFFSFFISLTGICCLLTGLLLLPVKTWQEFLSRFLPSESRTKKMLAGGLFILAILFYAIPFTSPVHEDAVPSPTPPSMVSDPVEEATPTPSPLPTYTPTPSPTTKPTPSPTPSPVVTPSPTPEPTAVPTPVPTAVPVQQAAAPELSAAGGGSGNDAPAVQPEAPTEVVEPSGQGGTVYIASSGKGKKYHSDPNCSSMNGATPLTKSEAEARGYTPCKKCYG